MNIVNPLKSMRILIILILFSYFSVYSLSAFSSVDKVEGLEYVIRKIDNSTLEKNINKNYDLYELYLENRSDKTFSIPGYSIDLGIEYSNISEVNALTNNKSSKKSTVLNIAAGAASIAFSGIARRAASTAMKTVGSFRHKNSDLTDESFLSPYKTYIIYPNDGLSVFLLISKILDQSPKSIRFICHEEDSNVNHILINNNLEIRDVTGIDKAKENVIATPEQEQYK